MKHGGVYRQCSGSEMVVVCSKHLCCRRTEHAAAAAGAGAAAESCQPSCDLPSQTDDSETAARRCGFLAA